MRQSTLLNGLKRLAQVETAPFDELHLRSELCAWLDQLKIPHEVDRYGNLLARVRRGHARRMMAFVGHLDHPALCVESISGNAIRCNPLGGLPTRGIKSTRVIFPRTTNGVLNGTIQTAVTDPKSDRRRLKSVTVRVTTKNKMPQVGDVAVLHLPPFKRAGNRLKMRVADDLAGVAAIVAGLDGLAHGQAPVDALALFTRAEEVGFRGTIGFCVDGRLPRDAGVVSVECSQALADVKLGQGPVVRLGDRQGPFDPRLSAVLLGSANELSKKKFTFQKAMLLGGTCEATAFTSFGYAATGIAIPMINYHNQGPRGVAPEEIDVRDVCGASALIQACALRAAQGTDDLDLLRNELILSSEEDRDFLKEPVSPITGHPHQRQF